ncbi:opioid growth factor receptor-like protein 1 [Pecten maximus]|uniref:opioid growth factor receptor-like protein 1 n=1 Tax=Pecten maximus TaxID=6579 RepID=UPI00145802F2|nr:opioid growth factor receptor-like protein 1 [Pecten maximus]
MSKASKTTRGVNTSSSEGAVSNKDRFKQTKMGNYMSDEESPTQRGRARGGSRHNFGPSFFRKWSDEDTEQYRKGYPGKKDHPNQKENLLFYTGQIKSHPDGDYIENIHENWWGNFRLLESHHGYIQWLFPIRESGMNFYSQELQLHEIKKIIADKPAHARVLKSYEMMLDFYGMVLESKETGQIKRGEDWKSRFQHLNRSYHNYLRITRILKSLGEFDYEHLKRPFVEFVLQEALESGKLANVLESCVNYWIGTIKDDDARQQLKDYVRKMEGGYGMENAPSDDEVEMEDSKQVPKHQKEQSVSTTLKGEKSVKDSNNSSDVDVEFSDSDSQEMKMWAKADLLGSADVDIENRVCDNDVKEGPMGGSVEGKEGPPEVPEDKEGGPEEEKMEVEQNSMGEENTPSQIGETQPNSLSQV